MNGGSPDVLLHRLKRSWELNLMYDSVTSFRMSREIVPVHPRAYDSLCAGA